MSRYIDADKVLGKMRKTFDMQDLYLPIHLKELIIDDMPTADVVEVVRCKDCVYYHPSYCEIWSKYGTVQTKEQGFCYMAERKGETNDS